MRVILYASLAIAVLLVQISGDPSLLSGPETVADPLGTGQGTGNPFTLISIIGAFVVFIFYWIKFSEWPGPGTPPAGFQHRSTRHSTTWIRYTCWGVTYAMFMVAAYFTIIVFPHLLVNVVQHVSQLGGDGDIGELVETLQESFFQTQNLAPSSGINLTTNEMVPYAVIVTTMLWAGAFSDFDRSFRRTIQQHALIPAEAQRLVDKLEQESETFTADAQVVGRILAERPELLIEESDFRATADTLPSKYARIEYVFYQITRRAMGSNFSKVFARYREELNKLEERLKDLRSGLRQYRSDQAVYLKSLYEQEEDPGIGAEEEKIDESLPLKDTIELMDKAEFKLGFVRSHFSQLAEKMTADVESILRNLYQVSVCSALAIGKSPSQRQKFFTDLGFKIPEAIGYRLERNTIVLIVVVLGLTIFAPSLIYYTATRLLETAANELVPRDIGQVMRWTLNGCLMHSLAFFAGYLVQRAADQKRELRCRPFSKGRAQIADYTECFIGGFTLNIFLLTVIFLMAGKFEMLIRDWAWALVPAVTAAFTGYFMHHVPPSTASFWRRALTQGLCTALATGLAMLLINDITAFLKPSNDLIMFTIYALLTTFVLGAVLGVVIQKWVKTLSISGRVDRRASRRHRVDMPGTWTSGEASIAVRIRDMSDGGVALAGALSAPEGTFGTLTLFEDDIRRAQVVRQHGEVFSCLMFVQREAPGLALVPSQPRLAS